MNNQITLSKAVDGFTLSSRGRHLSENTLDDYGRTLKRFLTYCGDVPVNSISPSTIAAFLAAQPYKAKTILNYHIGLSALWTWLIREELAEKHIVHMVPKPRPQKVAIVPFTESQVRAMLQAAGTDRDKAVIMLLLDTGLRASELCNIQRDDIDLVNLRIKTLGKGNKERSIPFSPRTSSVLEKHLSQSEGKPFKLDRMTLAKLIQRIGEKAGVQGAHAHRFRHTFAIQFLRNEADPFSLQEILGHSTMEMVRHYLALSQADVDAAHRKASPVEGWKL